MTASGFCASGKPLPSPASEDTAGLLGYTHEQLLGKELWEIGLFQDKASSQTAFRRLQERGYLRYDHLPLETRGGQQVDVEFVSNLYEADHQPVIQCNIRDITERRQLEWCARLRSPSGQAGQSGGPASGLGNTDEETLRATFGGLCAWAPSTAAAHVPAGLRLPRKGGTIVPGVSPRVPLHRCVVHDRRAIDPPMIPCWVAKARRNRQKSSVRSCISPWPRAETTNCS